ncbi:hypothetical protein [Salinispora oceanensis]|uniref:hypothetical protein n=1 Tax=Salinispora oceanensis TaxID=1050199 RepID=UPI0009B7AC70|nr:hypothetical protein [Salinispora oceanensis]
MRLLGWVPVGVPYWSGCPVAVRVDGAVFNRGAGASRGTRGIRVAGATRMPSWERVLAPIPVRPGPIRPQRSTVALRRSAGPTMIVVA